MTKNTITNLFETTSKSTMTPTEIHALSLMDWETILQEWQRFAISETVKDDISRRVPSKQLSTIRKELMETTEARRIIDASGVLPMNGLTSTLKAMEKVEKDLVLQPSELFAIAGFLRDVDRLKHFMASKTELAPTISLYALSASSLPEIREDIITCVSEEVVLDHASPELARLRRKIGLVEDKIKEKLEKILRSPQYKNVIQDALISQRNGRYVIPVKAAYKQQLIGSVHDKSTSGSTVFIEPEEVKRLHDELHELHIAEESEVYRILSELTNSIEPHTRVMRINLDIFRQYDFIFAKGKLSKHMEAVEPDLSDQPVMKLVSARHPLLGQSAVPLDFEVGYRQKGVVITGPNTGGKTVALKTVGLMSAMIRSGLHVPVEKGSVIGHFPKLLADIGDGQSIEQSLSTFSSHIKQIIEILKEADANALVILDEVGSGTDPTEGTGLAVAILEACYNQGSTLLATTHYHEIKTFAKEHPGFINGSMAFDTVSMKPLYRLILGRAGESNAFLIALKLGLSEAVLERAHQVTYGETGDFKAQLNHLWETHPEPEVLVSKASLTQEAIQSNESVIDRVFHEKDKSATELASTQPSRVFKIGDRVKIEFMNTNGTIFELENRKGEFGVLIMDKKVYIHSKRLSLYIASEDLYPEAYDFDIVFKSKDFRKKSKLINKGKGKGLVITE